MSYKWIYNAHNQEKQAQAVVIRLLITKLLNSQNIQSSEEMTLPTIVLIKILKGFEKMFFPL